MRSKIITRIIIHSIIAVLLLGILTVGLTFHRYRFTRKSSSSEVHTSISNGDSATVYADSDSISGMEIVWATGNIRVEAGDVDRIEVTESRKESGKPMNVEIRGDTLVIEYHEEGKFSGITISDHKDLSIFVPRDWNANKLVIEGASAKIDLTGLTIQNTDINTASGDCTIKDCSIDRLDVESASGKVIYDGCLREFDMDCASAKAELTLHNIPDSISMDSASGDLDLTLPEDCGFTAELDSLSGSIKSDFDLYTNDEGFYYGDKHCRIDMSGMSAGMFIHHGDAAGNHHSEHSK